MNDLQIFNNPQFGEVRTITEGGVTLFCGADVARALGYKRPNEAISVHCKGTVKRRTPTKGGEQEMLFIPEGDIYRLAARSDLPGADAFERWIFDEVLPSIRKTGSYSLPHDYPTALQALLIAERQMESLRTENLTLRSKALFAESVAASKSSILVGELAKLLTQNGVEMGQNRLFEWLRDNGYLIRRQGSDYNMPTQKSMEKGLFEIKETSVIHSDGHITINKTPKVTGKGQRHFLEAFLSGGASWR